MRPLVEQKGNFIVQSLPHKWKGDLRVYVFMCLSVIHTRLKTTRNSREDPRYQVAFLYSHFY